jgi:hypothetical protein
MPAMTGKMQGTPFHLEEGKEGERERIKDERTKGKEVKERSKKKDERKKPKGRKGIRR